MPITWRIVKKKHQPDALTGEGARRYGGRWNSAGNAILYTAETVSGALLEILVHSNRQLLTHYLVYRINIPKKGVKSIAEEKLPANWQNSPAPLELARIGDEWHEQQQSLALGVPNSIVPMEKTI